MKNLIKATAVIIIIFYSLHAKAASKHVDELMKTLGSQSGYVLVPIGKDKAQETSKKVGSEVYKGVDNILVLTTEDQNKKSELLAKAEAAIRADKLIEVTTVKEDGQKLKMYKDKGQKKFSSLIILVNDGDDCVLMSIKGDLNEDSVGGLMDNLNLGD